MNLDNELKKILDERLRHTPPRLREALEYGVLGPGKRIRPRLLLSTGEALGVEKERLLPVAAALEFIHAYTLIHDDLPCMDDDDERRGRKTTHKVYGEGLALLAGDSLIPLAFEMVAGSAFEAQSKISAIQLLSEISGANGVVAGQSLEEAIREKPSLPLLEKIFSLKTGALFRGCISLPAVLAGKPLETSDALGRLGIAFGIGFQVADDLEDDQMTSSKDPAHVLHYLDAGDAITWAESKLDSAWKTVENLADIQTKPLNPYFTEIRRKLAGAFRG